jgi:hypothetical protein
MKLWVVESSGGRKWRPASRAVHFTKSKAKNAMGLYKEGAPGLEFRVAKYERVKP